jgi:hypothetical protein
MALTEDEKMRVRRHLGYLNVALSQTFILGLPAGVQTQFVIEGAMDKIRPEGEASIRETICILDTIHDQLFKNTGNAEFVQVEDVTFRGDAFAQVLKRYQFFRTELANALGVYPNPYDQRFVGANAANPGINISVVH